MIKHLSLFNLLLLILSLVMSSCVQNVGNNNRQKYANVQQKEFDNMLAMNVKKYYHLGNDIQKKEFNDSVKLSIGSYMDSVKLFNNWEGTIEKIRMDETGQKSIHLSFEIKYKPEEYREICFEVDYVLPKDSTNSDKIYQTVRNLDEFSEVKFDGFIRTKSNGEAYYGNYSDDLIHSYPDFNFFLIDINLKSSNDSISDNLRNAINVSFESIEPLKLNFRGQISQKESDKRMKQLLPKFQAAKETLTKEERTYIDRLCQALTLNFIYGK